MIKKLFTALYADEKILYFNEGSGDDVFNCKGMDVLNIDLNNVNLDNNFDEDDLDTIVLIRLLTWHIKDIINPYNCLLKNQNFSVKITKG